MNNNEIQKLNNISSSLRKMSKKIKLISLLDRAKAEYEQNKFIECEQSLHDLLTKNPQNPIALRGLGCLNQALGNNQKALKYYNEALEFSENKEIEYTLIGTLYYNEENYDEAIKNYNLAIDINDDYDLAYEGKNQSMLERHLQILDMQDNLIKRKIFK